MRVLVSACLLGEKCKYNGESNYNQRVVDFLKDDEKIPVCPEVLGGLGVPRPSCELSGGRVIDVAGKDVTEAFEKGVNAVCKLLERQKIERVILQSRSPSCGVNQVYDGSFSGSLVPGRGLLAQKLIELGYEVLDAEDIRKLGE